MDDANIVVPDPWKRLDLRALRGVLMVIGAPDVGKSTFARYLYERLLVEGKKVAFLDGDPGQSTLGPPTSITLGFPRPGETFFPPHGEMRRRFVGSVTPSGHMLPMLVGVARLVQAAFEFGADVVVYDTSGLIDPNQGGTALKLAKIDMLRPDAVFAIQNESELESLLIPLRRSQRTHLVDVHASPEVHPRDSSDRQANRAAQFSRYFHSAQPVEVDWTRLPIFPAPRFSLSRLVSFDDIDGFMLGLGIVQEIDRQRHTVKLLTPFNPLDRAQWITLGDISLDLTTFRDYRI